MNQVIAIILSDCSQESGFSEPRLLFFQQAPGESFDELMVRIFRTIQTHEVYRRIAWKDPEDQWGLDEKLFVSVNCTVADHYPRSIREALLGFLKEEKVDLYSDIVF